MIKAVGEVLVSESERVVGSGAIPSTKTLCLVKIASLYNRTADLTQFGSSDNLFVCLSIPSVSVKAPDVYLKL